MKKYCKVLIAVSMTTMSATSLVACDGGDNHAVPAVSANPAAGTVVGGNGNVNACDGIRLHLRQQVIKTFGFDHMADAMKRISVEISSSQLDELKHLTDGIDTSGNSPQLYRQLSLTIQSIYADAIERTGMHVSAAEAHDDIHRAISAEPTGEDPLADGYSQVLSSSASGPAATAAPVVGSVTKAILGVSADQSSYEFLFIKIKTVSPGPNNGYEASGDPVTMSQYIDTLMPSSCAQSGSALPLEKINRMAAE